MSAGEKLQIYYVYLIRLMLKSYQNAKADFKGGERNRFPGFDLVSML
jgi:hypothetical protein